MKENIVVIGCNSFSGASFIDFLLSDEAPVQILGISRSSQPIEAFLPYQFNQHNLHGRFDFLSLDLNRDIDAISSAIARFAPRYVVNFAAQGMVAESWQHPDHWYQTNVLANVRLHDRLRSLSGLEKYVHISTPEVYGNCEGRVEENTRYNPSTPYAASRAACDLHLMTFFRQYRFPVTFTRAANVYGPGQQLYRIIPRTILCGRSGKKLKLHGGGHSVRSFIHIRDVADGTARVMRSGVPGEIYHLSTPRYLSIRELVEIICKKMNVPFANLVEITDDRPGKDAAYILDSAKARNTLNWSDTIPLETGIEETVRWIERYFNELKNQPWDYQHKP